MPAGSLLLSPVLLSDDSDAFSLFSGVSSAVVASVSPFCGSASSPSFAASSVFSPVSSLATGSGAAASGAASSCLLARCLSEIW